MNETHNLMKLTVFRKILNDEIIKNIRLWDHRPLLTTYNQIQTLRQYYDFQNIDV